MLRMIFAVSFLIALTAIWFNGYYETLPAYLSVPLAFISALLAAATVTAASTGFLVRILEERQR